MALRKYFGVYVAVCIASVVSLLIYILYSPPTQSFHVDSIVDDSKPMQRWDDSNIKYEENKILDKTISPLVQSSSVSGRDKTWRKGSFCYKHLVDTFKSEVPMCDSSVSRADQVRCAGNEYTAHMAQCSYNNIAIKPMELKSAIPNDVTWRKPSDRAVNLLDGTGFECKIPSVVDLKKKTDANDFQVRFTQHMLESSRLQPSACDIWINKTAIFHVSNAIHIYFRLMNMYSVHKSILDSGAEEGEYQVIRIGSLSGRYHFPDFDAALFPGALSLLDFPVNATVCFKKALLSPRSYQSIPFRCKMEVSVRGRCFECNGKKLTDSPFQSFRRRVLKACNIIDEKLNKSSTVVVISRKPYQRWDSDDPKKFQRVLRNEDEMVAKIRSTFPHAVVRVLHMEALSVCEQVRHAVEADVMLGVHGAGLVHFWWMREDAHALELEPSFQIGNPSFRMLTTLAGRNYQSEKTSGTRVNIKVNANNVINKIRSHIG